MCFAEPMWHERIPGEYVYEEELNMDLEIYPLLPEWMFEEIEQSNPLDFCSELDDSVQSGNEVQDSLEEDWDVDILLEALVQHPHIWCDLHFCPHHGQGAS